MCLPQGRVVPCEFIGIMRSQQSVYLKGEVVSNHDELMCNFFAQVRLGSSDSGLVTLSVVTLGFLGFHTQSEGFWYWAGLQWGGFFPSLRG